MISVSFLERAYQERRRRWTLIHMMLAREDHWARANRLGLIVTAQQPLLYTLDGRPVFEA